MTEYELSGAVQTLLDKSFRLHPDSQDQTQRMDAIKEKCFQLARYIMRHTPQGCDEQKEIIRCIREVAFWGTEAIRKNEL